MSDCAYVKVAAEHSKLKIVTDAYFVEQTVNEIFCEFEFRTADWDSLQKTAVFIRGTENVKVILDETNICQVPPEILLGQGEFNVGVFGSDESHRLPTNLLKFKINMGCYCDGTAPEAPAQDVYQQILNMLAQKQNILNAGDGITIDGNTISATGDKSYIHKQNISESIWTIAHNLGKYPSITIVDSAKNVVVGDISYIDENSLVVSFQSAFSGTAYIN